MKKNVDAASIRTLNDKDRMWYVNLWAEYVKMHSDKEWSEQQNVIINSQLQSAQAVQLTPKQYLTIKEAGKAKRRPNRRS